MMRVRARLFGWQFKGENTQGMAEAHGMGTATRSLSLYVKHPFFSLNSLRVFAEGLCHTGTSRMQSLPEAERARHCRFDLNLCVHQGKAPLGPWVNFPTLNVCGDVA